MQTPYEIIADLERRLSALERTRQAAAGGGGGSNPTATVIAWAGADTAAVLPSGYLACDGAAVSRTTYAALFAAIGTKYGAGDGTTTFNLPDGNDGQVLSGIALTATTRPTTVATASANATHSHGGSTASGSASHSHGGSTTTAGGSHSHSISTDNQSASHSHSYTDVWNSSGGTTSGSKTTGSGSASHSHGGSTTSASVDHSHSISTDNQSASHSHTISSDNAAHSHTTIALSVTYLIKT